MIWYVPLHNMLQDPDPSDTIVYDFTFVYVTMNNPNLQIYTGPQSNIY